VRPYTYHTYIIARRLNCRDTEARIGYEGVSSSGTMRVGQALAGRTPTGVVQVASSGVVISSVAVYACPCRSVERFLGVWHPDPHVVSSRRG
jgi:hypothetical protein